MNMMGEYSWSQITQSDNKSGKCISCNDCCSLTQDDINDYELGNMVSCTVIPETEPLWSHYLHRI